jgi:hypothetical protein
MKGACPLKTDRTGRAGRDGRRTSDILKGLVQRFYGFDSGVVCRKTERANIIRTG